MGGVRTATASYKGHRFPVEIIDHCVWLYFRFSLSFREVEEMLLARGVVLSYETIRRWCAKCLRQPATSTPPPPRRQVAPRRGVREDQRDHPLPVARGRPARQRLGRVSAVTAKRKSSQAVFPQLAQGLRSLMGSSMRSATRSLL